MPSEPEPQSTGICPRTNPVPGPSPATLYPLPALLLSSPHSLSTPSFRLQCFADRIVLTLPPLDKLPSKAPLSPLPNLEPTPLPPALPPPHPPAKRGGESEEARLPGGGGGEPGGGERAALGAVTHPDSDGNSPKFFVTQKVNRRPGLPPPPTLSPRPQPYLPSPPPASQMGRHAAGKGEGDKKGRLCKGKQKRQRDIKRQETWGDRESWWVRDKEVGGGHGGLSK